MSTAPPQITNIIIPEEKKRSRNIRSVIVKYLYHWPLFLISILLAISVVVVYLHFAKPVYEITATLIIKDNMKAPEQQSALSEIDLVSSSKLIENEMTVLKSNRLISEVVKELNLGISYSEKNGLDTKDLYKSSPVKLILLKAAPSAPRGSAESNDNEIAIVIKDKNTFLLKNKDKPNKEYAFNTPLSNHLGTWKLEATDLLPKFKDATVHVEVLDPAEVVLQYQKAIEVSSTDKLATSISLTLEDQVAQRGKDVLDQLISDYSQSGTQENEQKTKATLVFLDRRLDSLSSELNVSEAGIEGYKSSRGLTDISAESRISLENMQDNDKQLNEVNIKLSIINGIESYVNSSKSGQAPATMGIEDPALNSLVENLSRLQLQRDRLLAISPETNPDFDPINRQIATTRAAIKENIRSIKSSLINTRSKLQSFNAGFESSIKKIPTQERQLVSSKRQQSVKEGLYTYLLQKREEIATNYANIVSVDRVVDQAYAGPAKTPKKIVFLAMAFLLGIALPVGIVYGREKLNDAITDAQEIKDAVDISIIGEISFEKTPGLISVKTAGTNAISEQLRTLRTNLHYLYGEKTTGRITLVTSSIAGEGKSFISSNLGLTFAHIERKTVILEMDLRQPKLRETFEIKTDGPGITEFLNGKATFADIVHPSGLNPYLHVIGSGAVVSNPSELLERKQLTALIAELRETYDDIIIDSPPVHLVPDALILSRLADVTLYIIKQGYTSGSELDFLNDLNNKKQLTNMQIVFNGVERAKYGYGYKYSNSYYNNPEKKTIFSDFWKRF